MGRRNVPVVINILTTIIVLAVIVLIGIAVLDSNVEKQLGVQVESLLKSAGLEAGSGYAEIESDAVNGKIAMKGVDISLDEQNLAVKADRIAVQVIPSEIVKVAVNKDSGVLSQAQVSGEQVEIVVPDSKISTTMDSMELTVLGEVGQKHLSSGDAQIDSLEGTVSGLGVVSPDDGLETYFEKVTFDTSGDFSQKAIESNTATIRDAEVLIENITTVSAGSGITTKIGSLEANLSGEVSQKLLSGDLSPLFEKPNSVQMTLKDTEFSMNPEALTDVPMMGFEGLAGAFLQDVTISEMFIDMDTTPDSLDIKSLVVNSDLFSGDGTVNARFDDEQLLKSMVLNLEINELNEDIRMTVGPLLAFMGMPIPEDKPFTFVYTLTEEGAMDMAIE